MMNRMICGPLLALVVLATSTLSAQGALIGSFIANGPSTFSLDGSGAFQGTSAVNMTLEGVGSFQATVSFNGQLTSGTGASAFGNVGQNVSSFAFTITGAGGENYLSGSTGAGTLSGPDGGGTANIAGSTQGANAGAINYTSDYLIFQVGDRNFNISLSAFLALTGGNLDAVSGSVVSGFFNGEAQSNAPAVPEPASLTLLGLGGVFALGAARLRRR